MTDIRGILIASQIIPAYGDGDGVIRDHPTHLAQFGKGGWREVSTIEERDAITDKRLEVGMAVYVTGSGKLYILSALDTTTTPYTKTWTEFSSANTSIRQVDVLPTEALYDFEIVEYIGNTTPDHAYVNGYFYQYCINTTEDSAEVSTTSSTITNIEIDKETFKEFVNPTQDTTLNFTFDGSSWIREDTSEQVTISDYGVSFENEPVENDIIEIVYTASTSSASWEQINVQPEVDVSGKVDKVETAEQIYGTDAFGEQTTYNKSDFGLVDDVRVNEQSVVVNKIANIDTKDRVRRVTQLPTTPESPNEIVQYTGNSISTYIKGYFYQSSHHESSALIYQAAGGSLSNLRVDKIIFEEQISEDGTYNFIFDGIDWYLNDAVVNLENYGIGFDGTPIAEDIITVDYISEGYNWTQINTQPRVQVVDSLESTSSTYALSANQGRILQGEIEALQGLGRYLTTWNCSTGLPDTNPPESENPYVYKSGDYYLISAVSTETNYRPDVNEYVADVPSTIIETEEVSVNDVYIYDGHNWKLQYNTEKVVTFGNIAGDPYDNAALSEALNDSVEDVKVNGVSVVDENRTANININSEDRIRRVTSLSPEAEPEFSGEIVQYIGSTNQNYTNGFFYKENSTTTTENWVEFEPAESGSVCTCSFEDFKAFIEDVEFSEPYTASDVVRGRINAFYANDRHSVTLYGETEFLKYFAPTITEWEEAGFTFTPPLQQGDSINFTCAIDRETTTRTWTRVNVQPSTETTDKQDKDHTEVYKVGFNGGWEDANSIVDAGSHIAKTDNADGTVTIDVDDITDDGLEIAADDTGLTTGKAVYEYGETKVGQTDTASQLYGTDDQGDQTTLTYGTEAIDSYIVQRDEDGQIIVPETPTEDEHAVSKLYADSKVSKTEELNKVYGTNDQGEQVLYDVNNFGNVNDVKVDGESVVDNNKIANITLSDRVRRVKFLTNQTEPEIAGEIVQFIGATDQNHTNGYFYKCTGRNTTYYNIQFTPLGEYDINVSISGEDLNRFLNETVRQTNFPITHGRFGYLQTTPEVSWYFDGNSGYSYDGFTYNNTPEGYAELGFTVTPPIDVRQGLDYTVENTTTWIWERVDVQPNSSQGLGRFLSLWNSANGTAETNPPTNPYLYNDGDYFIINTVAVTHDSSATIEQTSGDSLTDLAIDNISELESQLSELVDTTLVFTYVDNGSYTGWMLGSEQVDIDDYSISFEGTPVADDEITVEYTAAVYNYRPNGNEYIIGTASVTVETEQVKPNDVYIYDGTTWKLQINSQRDVTFSSIIGSPYDNADLAEALDSKVEDVQVNGVSVVDEDKIANLELQSSDIAYTNTEYASMQTIQDALDHLLYVSPVVSITGGGKYEIGSTVNDVVLTWNWNKQPINQSLNQGIGSLDPSIRSYTYDTPLTSDITFTITGSDDRNTVSSSTSVLFMPKRYWGVSANTSLTDADILALSQELSESRQQTREFDCTGGKYFYFVIRTSYCNNISFKVGGLTFSDMDVETRSVVNAQGFSAQYNIYRVHNIQTGTGIEVQVL